MAFFARAPLLCAAFFAIAPLVFALVQNEIQITLYISQVARGAGTNQAEVIKASSNNHYFGLTTVSDWPILDGPGPSAKVVGRAQGFHMKTSQSESSWDWYTSMNFVFNDATRFNGSTLQVIGILPFASEWSIVGGTGQFSMARGVIKYSVDPPSTIGPEKRLYKLNVRVCSSSMDSTTVYGKTGCISTRSEPIVDN